VPGNETQVTASQLQLTQLVGSAGDQQVLLNQPKASIIARARLPRGDRLVSISCRRKDTVDCVHWLLSASVGLKHMTAYIGRF
jgi:hypothetical protein